jgi:hypothetical protein
MAVAVPNEVQLCRQTQLDRVKARASSVVGVGCTMSATPRHIVEPNVYRFPGGLECTMSG